MRERTRSDLVFGCLPSTDPKTLYSTDGWGEVGIDARKARLPARWLEALRDKNRETVPERTWSCQRGLIAAGQIVVFAQVGTEAGREAEKRMAEGIAR